MKKTVPALIAGIALTVSACGQAVSGDAGAGELTMQSSAVQTTADTSAPDTTEPETTAPETSEPDTTEPTTQDTSEPETSEPETTEPESVAETYVYYVVDTRNEVRLARELREVPEGVEGAAEAVRLMIDGAQDPDYGTTWNPDTVVHGVQEDGDVIIVDLSADAQTANVGSGGAAMMVQQLVWTVTEALDRPDAGVLLQIDGGEAGDLWGVLTWSEPMTRSDPTTARVLVQIDTPREGAQLTSPVTISGDAAAFEANVLWRIVDAGGAEVDSGFTMTSEGGTFAPYSFEVELEPGSYTVQIIEDDPSDGEAGPPSVDTRSFTVLP